MKTRYLLPFVGFLASACGSQPQSVMTDETSEGSVRTIVWTTDPERTLESRISSVEYCPLESTPESFLTDISKMIIYQGEIFIADFQNIQYGVRVFGLDGHYKRHIGREGRGPGEVIRLHDFTIRNDTVFLVDGNAAKMSRYTILGEFVGDRQIPTTDFECCAAGTDGFLWTGAIYVGEQPEDRFGLFKTDNSLRTEWQKIRYTPFSTRGLLTEVSDSVLIWMQECSDSLWLCDRHGAPLQCIHLDFKNHRIPYEKRKAAKSMRADDNYPYYAIAAWNPSLVAGRHLMGTVIQPGGVWDTFLVDLNDGAVYTDGDRHLIRNRTATCLPVNDSTFMSWITPDSEAFLETEPSVPQLPSAIREKIADGDCALVFYTLRRKS